MAGGKSTRMKTYEEKTIIPILGKPMIEYVIEAVLKSKVNQIFVTTSPSTPKTKQLIQKYDIRAINTAGKGYHEDLNELLQKFDLEIVLTISGDLPLIRSDDINQIIEFYKKSKKPSISVMATLENFEKYNLKPTYIMDYEGEKLVPIGINIIDGRINPDEWQEQAIMKVNQPQLLINVNAERDLEKVTKYLKN